MDKGHETPKFVSSRVAERINENPVLASFVLGELVNFPKPDKDLKKTYEEEYGADFAQLHQFLGAVISDVDLYYGVNVPEEAAEAADTDPAQQERIKKLRSGRLTEEEKIELTMSNRANQLLAMARISVAHTIEEQANFQLEEVN